jgi:Zn-dependent M28 family amino/carboxypeptidase
VTRRLLLALPLAALAACTTKEGALRGDSAATAAMSDSADLAAAPAELRGALATVTSDELMRYIQALSADSMEGRAPGTPGEEKTVRYIAEQFRQMGLAPGNPDGTYVQNVAMVGYTSHPTATITAKGTPVALSFPDDYVAVSRHARPRVMVNNSDIVFVGYGVVAPEYGWDDYKGKDVKGKTIVMLVNDPPVPLASDTAQLDTAVFKGRAMTYYGRWTYKYEEALRKGAAAALVVHETGPAGYPFDVVKSSWGRENFDIVTSGPETHIPVEAWITRDKAVELFKASGLNFDSLKAVARTKEFTPVDLPAKASFDVKVDSRRIQSKNVVGKLPGSDSALANEYVVFTAHWDHFGRDTALKGDQIYNGAIDNASGVAEMLALANAYSKLEPKPKRSLLFVSVTGEERNLLGAKAYATNPLYPLDKTLADVNLDEANVWGPTKDITVIGYGSSTLDDVLRQVASSVGRTVKGDPEPEKGGYYRSDHFEFAKQGVPALYISPGVEPVGGSAGGESAMAKFDETDYHQVTDEVKPDWNLAGAIADTRLLFRVSLLVANGDQFPQWKPGTEFKAKRDSALAGAKR